MWDNTDDTIVMLSNQHVFGNTPGTPILQPGSGNAGTTKDRIGQVKRSIPIIFGIPLPETRANCVNFVDAAIGEADSSELSDLSVLEIGPAVYEITDPIKGLVVEKFGKESGHTVGIVSDVDYNPCIPYPVNNMWIQTVICDSIRIESLSPPEHPGCFALSGDSGSVVFKAGGGSVVKQALGLLYAGFNNDDAPCDPKVAFGVACKITNVFAALDLAPLCTAGCAAFVDALTDPEANDNTEGLTLDHLYTPDVSPPVFTNRERQRRRTHQFHAGLANDLRKRVMTSRRGRGLLKFIERHRGELLTLAVRDGDTRRSMVAALRPLFVGAITTTDVLRRTLTEQDIKRLDKLAAVLASTGSSHLCESLKVLQALLDGATDRTLAEILEIAR